MLARLAGASDLHISAEGETLHAPARLCSSDGRASPECSHHGTPALQRVG